MIKKIMIMTLIMLNMIAISSSSWIMLWVMMEMSTYLFLSQSSLSYMKTNKKEFFLIYFSMSFLVSIMLLSSFIIFQNMSFNILATHYTENFMSLDKILITMSFLLKMGSIPFHGWMFSAMENMSWNTMLILSTIQKIIPIWAIFLFLDTNMMMYIIFLSSVIMVFLPLKTKSMFYFMATSASMNSMWIMISAISSLITTIFYTTIYFLITTSLIFLLKKYNTIMMNSNWMNASMLINMLSLIGIPPLLGFFSKMNTMMSIMMNKMNMLIIMLMLMFILSTSFTSFMYLKTLISNISSISNKKTIMVTKNKNMMKTIMVNLLFPLAIMFVEVMV